MNSATSTLTGTLNSITINGVTYPSKDLFFSTEQGTTNSTGTLTFNYPSLKFTLNKEQRLNMLFERFAHVKAQQILPNKYDEDELLNMFEEEVIKLIILDAL